ncbi:MAG: hypothetical protein ACLGI6_06910 [Gammaproteobacteria bacterium]
MANHIVGVDNAQGNQAHHDGHKDEGTLAERKSRLLRQAEFHRVNIVNAKSAIKQGARPEALFHSALDHAQYAVRDRIDHVLRPTGTSVASMMPYALSILSFLRRRRLVKPALGVAAAAAGLAWYVQRQRNSHLPH